ncbi:fibronectin type III domain-containing protein [Helicobacter sp. MIT 99-5507]|uniref:fibronectin type III domain-containing protein n=1 Tax=Helicobacter sp. MIT 99-5507 TaxID=152489 RepID=UPI000E1E3434|nr:fibronectin type III domain-containing protein [Helicobacter sp. MIT 99-5507]RDU57840.1 hypothetical protein CQA42_02750 [Helicobacter sp. MIT 99-5507]
MRFLQIFHLIILAMIFSACSSTLSHFNGVDNNIPKIKNIKTIVGVSEVAFEWSVMTDSKIQGYLVYRNSGEGYKEIAHIKNPLISHYVDTNLIPEKEYSYYFYVLGKDTYSDRSDIIKVKTSYIAPVTNLYASNDYPKKVKLIWSPHKNPSISHYLIQRSDDNINFKTIANIDSRLSAEYFDEKLNDASSYSYRIIAVDFLGAPSRPSKIVIAKTKDRPILNTTLSASNNYIDKIELKWNPLNNISDYKIFRASKIDSKYNQIATTKDAKFIDGNKSPGVEYFYKISGIDSSGIESEQSEPARGSTKELIKSPNITKGYIDNNKARIEWSGSSDAKYYFVYRRSGLFGSSMKFRVDDNYFIDNDMSDKEYTYYVVAVDEFGIESKKSQEVTLQIK